MKKLLLALVVLTMPILMNAAIVDCTTGFLGNGPDTGGIFAVFGADAAAFTGAGNGCQLADKTWTDFQAIGESNLPPSATGVRMLRQIVGGQEVFTLSLQGNFDAAYGPFAFQYTQEVVGTTHTMTRLAGDIAVSNGQRGTNATLTKIVDAYDATGTLIGGALTFSATGTNPNSIALPSGTTRIVVQDYFDPNTGGATGINNGVTQTAVPEPATMGLLGVGLAAMGFAVRRRRA